VYIIEGGLLRRLELVIVIYKNSANRDSRGINIKDSYVRVMITYYKNIR
jgi:hypothetical protein